LEWFVDGLVAFNAISRFTVQPCRYHCRRRVDYNTNFCKHNVVMHIMEKNYSYGLDCHNGNYHISRESRATAALHVDAKILSALLAGSASPTPQERRRPVAVDFF
jgi:hypothetical protein